MADGMKERRRSGASALLLAVALCLVAAGNAFATCGDHLFAVSSSSRKVADNVPPAAPAPCFTCGHGAPDAVPFSAPVAEPNQPESAVIERSIAAAAGAERFAFPCSAPPADPKPGAP